MPADPVLWLSSCVFCGGMFLVLSKRDLLVVLIGAELLLQAAIMNWVRFDNQLSNTTTETSGITFVLFIIPVAVAEMAIALAMILALYRLRKKKNATSG